MTTFKRDAQEHAFQNIVDVTLRSSLAYAAEEPYCYFSDSLKPNQVPQNNQYGSIGGFICIEFCATDSRLANSVQA